MFRTGIWYIFGWLYLILTSPLLLKVIYLEKCKKNNEKDSYSGKFTRKFSRFMFYLTGSKIKITGQENVPDNQPVLFVSNHQSHIDSAVIHGFINGLKGFVSIVEAKKIPILGTWMKHINCVFMDRSDPRQTLMCINQSIKLLKQGHSMIIYPEGKLSDGVEVAEFQKGCLRLAVKAGVPIIPITIKGSHKLMTKNGREIRPVVVECIISEPVLTKGIQKDEEKKLVNTVRDIIVKNL